MRDAGEGQQVALAERMEGDLSHDDELVVSAVVWKRRRVEGLGREHLGVGRRDAARGLAEALVGEVGAERFEQVVGRLLERDRVDAPPASTDAP